MQTWHNDTHPIGEGPWRLEPDKVYWIDDRTNLDCLIVRSKLGALCGYVGVPYGHPLYGLDYEDLEPPPAIHHQLTYAAACQPSDDPSTGVCHVPPPGRTDDVWWFGFDCMQWGDLVPAQAGATPRNTAEMIFAEFKGHLKHNARYRTISDVKREVEELAMELA